jgi:RimJ/RimL family protein N-acetyltransferase
MTQHATSSIVLSPISASAAEAILAGRPPCDVRVAADYPTEFSAGIARTVGGGSPLGPYFVHRMDDDVVVGEIGGGFVSPGVVEIGYAVVGSCWSRGYATDALRALISIARHVPSIERILAHNPVDRPASGRVLQKVGFSYLGEADDEHEGQPLRVHSWELALTCSAA